MNVSLSQWQTNVWKDPHRYVVVNCGRRAGKTYVTALKMLDFATKNNKVDVWYVAPTYKQAKGILWEMLLNFVPREVIKRKNETELRITLINDSSIFVKGAEEPDNLRGVKIDLCVFDECAFIDKWETVWTVMRPMLIDSKARVIFISTPNGLQNHFKTLADQYMKDDDFSYHHYTTYDNPFLDKGEIEEARKEMSEDAFAQEHLGEFRRMSGLIFKEFKREIHMVTVPFEQFNSNWTYTRVIDFGFGHKTAIGYFAISPNQNEIYMYDGLYVSGFTERQIADVCKVKDGGRTITNPLADSAQPMAIAELMNYGIIFNPITKGKDSVVAGIGQLAELLKVRPDTGRPTLMFNKTLDWVPMEFERYHWIPNKNDPGEIKQIPYKVLDDCVDMCFTKGTLIKTKRGDIQIERVTSKDYVWTPLGWSKVVKGFSTGKKQVNDYGIFKATSNHRVFTNRGFVSLDNIRYSDIIMVCTNQKQLYGMGLSSGDTLLQKIVRTVVISNILVEESMVVKQGSYTEEYGNFIMDLYQKIVKSIIWMVTLLTTILKIWNVSLIENTQKDTTGESTKDIENILKELDLLQRNGTLQKKEKNTIKKLEQCHSKIDSFLKRNVSSVEKNMNHIFQRANTVIKIVKPQHCGEEEVFNLESTNGMYFANNVLVHNCRYFAHGWKAKKKTLSLYNRKKWSIH